MTKEKEPIDSAFLDGDNASYDDIAKRFLAHKILLAQILKELVEEFKDCPLRDIAEKYIEGEPAVNISEIPIDEGLTNAVRRTKDTPEKIKGRRNEDNSPTEGTIVFESSFMRYYRRRRNRLPSSSTLSRSEPYTPATR